jgi:hypothetical protein
MAKKNIKIEEAVEYNRCLVEYFSKPGNPLYDLIFSVQNIVRASNPIMPIFPRYKEICSAKQKMEDIIKSHDAGNQKFATDLTDYALGRGKKRAMMIAETYPIDQYGKSKDPLYIVVGLGENPHSLYKKSTIFPTIDEDITRKLSTQFLIEHKNSLNNLIKQGYSSLEVKSSNFFYFLESDLQNLDLLKPNKSKGSTVLNTRKLATLVHYIRQEKGSPFFIDVKDTDSKFLANLKKDYFNFGLDFTTHRTKNRVALGIKIARKIVENCLTDIEIDEKELIGDLCGHRIKISKKEDLESLDRLMIMGQFFESIKDGPKQIGIGKKSDLISILRSTNYFTDPKYALDPKKDYKRISYYLNTITRGFTEENVREVQVYEENQFFKAHLDLTDPVFVKTYEEERNTYLSKKHKKLFKKLCKLLNEVFYVDNIKIDLKSLSAAK